LTADNATAPSPAVGDVFLRRDGKSLEKIREIVPRLNPPAPALAAARGIFWAFLGALKKGPSPQKNHSGRFFPD
jgi:hypothetical protein